MRVEMVRCESTTLDFESESARLVSRREPREFESAAGLLLVAASMAVAEVERLVASVVVEAE